MVRDNRLSTTALGEAPKLPASDLELLQELQSHKITLCPVSLATLGNRRRENTDWTRVISRDLSLPFQGPAALESHIPQGFNITKADI